MAATCYRVPRHAIGSTIVELSRPHRTGAPPPVRISARSHGIDERETPQGPSCIFVGPIDTASQATLEALYLQARDSYYGGSPLIPDDMFDRVELKLRWYGSQYVVKYPRCSLRRQATYADAQEDPPQVFALASIWVLILSIGGSVLLAPVIYTMGQACRDAFIAEMPFTSQASSLQFLTILNGILYVVLGSIIGYPIASASARALRGLWQNDLVALRGACPNCGDEVFAFVRSDKSSHSSHRTECHVCDSMLEFCTKVESISIPGQRWVYGRVYLIQKQEKRQR